MFNKLALGRMVATVAASLLVSSVAVSAAIGPAGGIASPLEPLGGIVTPIA